MATELKRVFGVYAGLLALLALTVIASEFRWGIWSAPLSLGIATAKALLVLLYFMKLRKERGPFWIVACASIFWISLLLGLTATDYLTR